MVYFKNMRPLFHPDVDKVTLEGILHALSDPVRASIFYKLLGDDCGHNCTNFADVSEKPLARSTLSVHFKALREAGLVRAERRGVEMHNTSRCAEVDKQFPGLLGAIVKAHAIQLEKKTKEAAAAKRKAAKV